MGASVGVTRFGEDGNLKGSMYIGKAKSSSLTGFQRT